MKKLKRIVFAMLLAAGIVFAMPKDAKAADAVTMTKSTRDGFSVKWKIPSYRNNTGYFIVDENTDRVIWSTEKTYGNIGNVEVEFTGAGTGFVSRVSVYSRYREDGDNTEYQGYIGSTYVNSIPKDISTKNFALNAAYSDGTVDFAVNRPANATKVELEIYNAKNKKIAKRTMYKYSDSIKISKAMGYKYRVRAYYTNNSTGKNYYGRWSGYRYFANPNATIKASKNTIKAYIKKGTGISSYTVYVSTKRDSGYKKVKTVKVGKKSKYTVTAKKYGKKKIKGPKYYYVKVVPKVKFGSKTYASDMFARGSIYVPRS